MRLQFRSDHGHDLEANGFFSDLLISEVFFRQRCDQLEEKRRQLSRDLAHHLSRSPFGGSASLSLPLVGRGVGEVTPPSGGAQASPPPCCSSHGPLLTKSEHRHDYHRTHTALGGLPPIARVNNLCENYN
jgi:hypothetical protein